MKNKKFDFRVFKTIWARIAFSLLVGLPMSVMCGGWIVFAKPPLLIKPFPHPFLSLLPFWLICAALLFCVTWLVDYGMSGTEGEK